MVKKLKTLGKADDKQLANAVRTSAQQIWQAGLGAFAKAQEEGGKVFTKLVKEGTSLQKRTQKMAEDKVSDVTGTVSKMAGDVSTKASGSWDKLETVFEERVSRALTSIGVPTQKDIQLLTQRVEQLSKAVAELSGKKAAAATPAEPAKKAASAAKSVKATKAATPVKAAKAPPKAATKASAVSKADDAAETKSATKPAMPRPAMPRPAPAKAAAKAKAPAKKPAAKAAPVDAAPASDTPAASE